MRRYSGQSAVGYAIGFIVTGLVLIGFGWKGGAATTFIPTQIAFSVSGGLAGLALVGTGAGLLNLHASRLIGADRGHELDRIITESAGLLAHLDQQRDARS